MNNQPVGRNEIEQLIGQASLEAVQKTGITTPHGIFEHILTNNEALKTALTNIDVDLYVKEYAKDMQELTELHEDAIKDDYATFSHGVLFGFALGIVFFKRHGYITISELLETKALGVLNNVLAKFDFEQISEEDLKVHIALMDKDPDNAYELHLKRSYGEVH